MSPALPSISVSTPNVNVAPEDLEHSHCRVFIGPMPEKVVSKSEADISKRKKRTPFQTSSLVEEDDISQVIEQNAFTFFLRSGGREEDWGVNEERSTREEMLQRWRNSEWGTIWARRQKQEARQTTSRWVGGSFEIGRFLGVSILRGTGSIGDRASSSARGVSFTGSRTSTTTDARPSTTQETFVTASSHLSPSIYRQTNGSSQPGQADSVHNTSPSSSTALLRPPLLGSDRPNAVRGLTEIIPRSIIRASSLDATSGNKIQLQDKGKGKLVHYADIPEYDTPGPAPPSEVLERSGIDVEDTSAGASSSPDPRTISPKVNLEWGDVIMRDRMLVRTCYTKSESLVPPFDEVKNRTMKDLQHLRWAEYMVAWRKDRIEIYKDYNLFGKEWYTGHKQLVWVIPLKSSRTQLSLYSFVDLAFCITCPPTTTQLDSASRWFFSRAKEGTNIFVFKPKSRSRAYDWTWYLWREMGGELPRTLEIRNPRVNTKVRIDIPLVDNDQIYRIFNRENVLKLCAESLSSVGDWKNLIERDLKRGKSLELAWRSDTNLDWIWLENDIHGKPRASAVLCGLALKKSTRPATLEIRLAEHYPNYLHLKNGNRLHEPPAIEGYLDRIKPNTQTKQSTYLATHDGNLFMLHPQHAHPPDPPGILPGMDNMETFAESLRQSEAQRGAMQCIDAIGVSDLRKIVLIRRAFHITPEPTHDQVPNSTKKGQGSKKGGDDDLWFGIWSQPEDRTPEDDEDEGGEEYLNKQPNKAQLRMHRSFELLLTTGRVIRFEAYSRRVAVEWIERLRALVLYWKQRHRIDAREEMDVAQARRPRLTPLTRVFQDGCELPPEPPADLSAPLPALGSLYNWCALEGCKPIIRGGKVYTRKGLQGQYKLVQLFLVAGHLIEFRITPKSSLHPARRRQTNLIDAYVCSGYSAALALPNGQYNANGAIAARRYQDGLETDDPEEDMLFMVWYHPQDLKIDKSSVRVTAAAPKSVPSLSAKRKLLFFRTRSKLERDAWCWALNCEIEKMVRAQGEREEKLRATGSLMKV